MSTLPNPRAAGQSAGNSRWFTKPVLPCAQFPTGAAGVLVIRTNGVSDALYDVVAVSNWYDPAHPDAPLTVHGWQVLPRKAGHSYDVCFETGQESCDCPDGTYRPHRPCKHWRALKAALEAAGLPLYGTANCKPSTADVRKANAGTPSPWWSISTSERPDGTWVLVGRYHWNCDYQVSAATSGELIAKMTAAEARRKQEAEAAKPKRIELANGRSLVPFDNKYIVFSEPAGCGRRLGHLRRSPDGWLVVAVSGSMRHRDYREQVLGTVARPEDAADLFPVPHPIVSRLAEEFTNRWTGD